MLDEMLQNIERNKKAALAIIEEWRQFNPHALVYGHIAFWDTWSELAKTGRKPPIAMRWTYAALHEFGGKIVAP